VLVSCDEAQEALSARLDGERAPVAGPALEAHLASCPACRNFVTGAGALRCLARLREPRTAPDNLVATLMPLLGPAPTGLLASVRKRRWGPPRYGLGWAGKARWAGAVVPVALAVAGISLGVGSHPHLVPTRPPSPCTIGLVARQPHHGG
jgi:predicted anti-sigma-YlaC factor YlaD